MATRFPLATSAPAQHRRGVAVFSGAASPWPPSTGGEGARSSGAALLPARGAGRGGQRPAYSPGGRCRRHAALGPSVFAVSSTPCRRRARVRAAAAPAGGPDGRGDASSGGNGDEDAASASDRDLGLPLNEGESEGDAPAPPAPSLSSELAAAVSSSSPSPAGPGDREMQDLLTRVLSFEAAKVGKGAFLGGRDFLHIIHSGEAGPAHARPLLRSRQGGEGFSGGGWTPLCPHAISCKYVRH